MRITRLLTDALLLSSAAALPIAPAPRDVLVKRPTGCPGGSCGNTVAPVHVTPPHVRDVLVKRPTGCGSDCAKIGVPPHTPPHARADDAALLDERAVV